MTKPFFLFVLFVTFLFSCTRRTALSTAISNDINTCGLVVLLSDRSNTAQRLRDAGSNAKADYILEHDRAENKKTIQLFSNACGFTDIYFTYKKNVDQLSKGVRTGIFLDSDLAISDQSLGCDNYYFIENGIIDKENEIERADDWIVKDANLKPVARPFPWRVNYPLDCLGRGKSTEIDCLCYKIEKHID